ncbi:MAG: hypothetical protein DRP45_08055 [Candidatus Zixiibacteriota bacterium]|nr:MAG: hypothetical protein DRP45_08055 [candidate division Zixibacteria bacterium]
MLLLALVVVFSTVLMPCASANGANNSSRAAYSGTLRVYVAETESRWDDDWGRPFHYAFLGFAAVDEINIADLEVWDTTLTWDASAAGFGDVTEGNLTVFAVLFNSAGHIEDLRPGYGYWFTAHDGDATAAAHPGESGRNDTTAGFTHTVFVEEGSATTCVNCPYVADALHDIHANDGYPLHYVTLVEDRSIPAQNRLNEYYNNVPVPVGIFDGGYRSMMGRDPGGDTRGEYVSRIEACGARVVPPLDMLLSVTWLGGGDLEIEIGIGNGAPASSAPNALAAPIGDDLVSPGYGHPYQVSTTDPESDSISYQFDWGDGSLSEWYGPYASGETCTQSYEWDSENVCDVRAKARDVWGSTTDWSASLAVSVECCIGTIGNLDGLGIVDGTDLTIMIDVLFIHPTVPLACWGTADCDGSGAPNPGPMDVDGTDLTIMIDHLFIGMDPMPPCP